MIIKQTTIGTTDFKQDIKRGKLGELIFKDDFLEFLGIQYEDVTGRQQFQAIDQDFIGSIGTYEIKTNYKDDDRIIIEEFTNVDKTYGPESAGWFYKSKADVLVCISKKTRMMILIPFTPAFKEYYETIKDNYELYKNRVSIGSNGRKWQSAFRRMPLEAINGYYAKYQKIPELVPIGKTQPTPCVTSSQAALPNIFDTTRMIP